MREKTGSMLAAVGLFIADIFIWIMYDGFWKTSIGEWILLIVVIIKAVYTAKSSKMIGIIGTVVLFVYGLVQVNWNSAAKMLTGTEGEGVKSRLLLYVAVILGMYFGFKFLIRLFTSNVGSSYRSSGTSSSYSSGSTSHSAYDSSDYNESRTSRPLGSCPYSAEDSGSRKYCTIAGGRRSVDNRQYSAYCSFSNHEKCSAYKRFHGNSSVVDDMQGGNEYMKRVSQYACPFYYQDKRGYSNCMAGGTKRELDGRTAGKYCDHQGSNFGHGYLSCQVYLSNK